MKKIIFNGYSLTEDEIYGIQRQTLELLKEMDSLINPGEIELVVQKSNTPRLNFKNIKVINLGDPLSIQGTNFTNKVARRLAIIKWKEYTFRKYVRQNQAISVDTMLCFPLWGCDVIAIYDCIPDLFPQHYIGIKKKLARFLLICRQRLAIKKCKLIMTPSEYSKKPFKIFIL